MGIRKRQAGKMLQDLSQSNLVHKNKPVIGIFDRDGAQIAAKIEKKNKEEDDNNMYAFCLPTPNHRQENDDNLCIELYYRNQDLHREIDGQRLYFKNEISRTGSIVNPARQLQILKVPENVQKNSRCLIFDGSINHVIEKDRCKVLSKGAFAKAVRDQHPATKEFNFEPFRLIMNKI